MTTISKEIEIDISDLTIQELIDELEDRIINCDCLLTDEGKNKMEPHINEMTDKLHEIWQFLQYPVNKIL